MTFEISEDAALIRDVFASRLKYPHSRNDDEPWPETLEVQIVPFLTYVIAREGSEILGGFMIVPRTTLCCELHFSLLPCAWGKRAAPIMAAFFQWLWGCFPYRRCIGAISASNWRAIACAKAAGAKEFGRNERAILKGGKEVDEVFLGITRPEGI